MIRRTTDLSPAARDGFDALIDVRSPSEFALDHIPGAINLPVLDDAQRAAVGTEYVQGAKFLARRLGAALGLRHLVAQPIEQGAQGVAIGRRSSGAAAPCAAVSAVRQYSAPAAPVS